MMRKISVVKMMHMARLNTVTPPSGTLCIISGCSPEYRTISEYQIIYTMPETILTAPFSKKTASTIPHRNINTIPPYMPPAYMKNRGITMMLSA